MEPKERASWVLGDAYSSEEACIHKALAIEGITVEDLKAIEEENLAAAKRNKGCEFDDVRARHKFGRTAAAAAEAARRLEAPGA